MFMIPPLNCPYKGLTAPPCWSCPNYIADADECKLSFLAVSVADKTSNETANNATSLTYEERLKDYERRRSELMQLSKETLVDLIIHKPF